MTKAPSGFKVEEMGGGLLAFVQRRAGVEVVITDERNNLDSSPTDYRWSLGIYVNGDLMGEVQEGMTLYHAAAEVEEFFAGRQAWV